MHTWIHTKIDRKKDRQVDKYICADLPTYRWDGLVDLVGTVLEAPTTTNQSIEFHTCPRHKTHNLSHLDWIEVMHFPFRWLMTLGLISIRLMSLVSMTFDIVWFWDLVLPLYKHVPIWSYNHVENLVVHVVPPCSCSSGQVSIWRCCKTIMSLEAACGMFFWRTCTVATKLCLGYFSYLIPNQYPHSFNSSMHRFSGSKGPTIRQLGLVIFTVKWTKRVLRSIPQSCTPNFDCSYIYIYLYHRESLSL